MGMLPMGKSKPFENLRWITTTSTNISELSYSTKKVD